MRKPHLGLWNNLTAKFDIAASSKAGAGGRPGKKRRHQRQGRICPIQLEPLEQRQLLTASVTQDLFAATTGTTFNTANFPWWTNVGSRGQSPTIVDDQFMMTGVSTNPGTYYLATGNSTTGINDTGGTVNSVQQVSFSALGLNSSYGLVARADSAATTFYGMEVGAVGATTDAMLNIYRSVNGTPHTIASVDLFTTAGLVLNFSTEYDLKFLVQTDAGNSSETDLYADVWQQGTNDPGWQLSTTDSTTNLNGTFDSGDDGILAAPNYRGGTGGGTDTSYLSNYVESNTQGDLPEITSFTSSPVPFSSSGTVTFNASATAPTLTFNPGGTAESISSYSLNFGDGNTLTSSAAMVNVTHTYTSIPAFAYAPTLTVTDSNGGTALEQIWAVTNTSVTTDPTATLVVDRDGGNGIKANNPLIVHFITTGTASSSDPLADYILNFGDGSPVMNMPVTGGTAGQTWTLDTDHDYSSKGTFDATLTVVGNDGATTLKSQSIFTTNSASAPTVTPSYNTSTNILTAVFSEDVGAALANQFNSSGSPLGEQIWSDGASTANTVNATNVSTGVNLQVPGSFAAALDIRNDNSGISISLAGDTFTYNNSDFTATWNLSSLTTPLNTTSTYYSARLFATDIQDQAGNDLDGINSGIGGQDATFNINPGYTVPTVSLYNSTTGWNTAMPLVFAPTFPAGSIQSIATTNVSGTQSTVFTFTSSLLTSVQKSLLENISGVNIILEDFSSTFAGFNGLTATDGNPPGNLTLTVPIDSRTFNDSSWTSSDPGSVHVSPTFLNTTDNIYENVSIDESLLINSLEQITGATSIPVTGSSTQSSAVYVGQTSDFTPAPYNAVFDNLTQLGQTGYIVNNVATSAGHNNLYIVGGGGGGAGENDAIDAFLQSLGMQQYGPQNNPNGSAGGAYAVATAGGTTVKEHNVWQITPSLTNLSGSWDIRQLPSIPYLENNFLGLGTAGAIQTTLDNWLAFNLGDGFPVPSVGQGNLSVAPNTTNLYAHPDWWASLGNVLTNSFSGDSNSASVATVAVSAGTISPNEIFSITLNNGSSNQTVSVTANSTDDTPSGIANALYSAISTSSHSFFQNLTVQTNTANDLWVGNATSGSWAASVPVVEFYLDSNASYTVTTATTNGSATIQANVTMISNSVDLLGHLNFSNPAVINKIINGYVANWLAGDPAPGSMLSMSPPDGGDYDESASTQYLMHSNNPFQTGIGRPWGGYNQNGVLVSSDSESYWTLVNDAADYLLINEAPGSNYYVGGLAYEAVATPPSFPLYSNVYMQVSELFAPTFGSLTVDQVLKNFAQKGGLTGVYKDWIIFPQAEPAPGDMDTSTIESDWKIYNNDHVTAIGGESNDDYGAAGLGFYLADVLNSDTSLNGSHQSADHTDQLLQQFLRPRRHAHGRLLRLVQRHLGRPQSCRSAHPGHLQRQRLF